jgi:hypothetical protein
MIVRGIAIRLPYALRCVFEQQCVFAVTSEKKQPSPQQNCSSSITFVPAAVITKIEFVVTINEY